jgi:hypothetical protein
VVRERLEMFDQAVGIEPLDCVYDLGVEEPTSVVEQASIGYVV